MVNYFVAFFINIKTTTTMKRVFLLTLVCYGVLPLFATHNRTGYIRYEQTGPLSITAVIVTLTDYLALPADRDTLPICWGDGQVEKVPRSNEGGDILENGFKRNIYIAEHTYAEMGVFILCLSDPNRSGGILNVNYPNSNQVNFFLQTTVTLLDLSMDRSSQAPIIQHEPTDLAYLNYPYVYDPDVVDPDFDSLAFELITPLKELNDPVPFYFLPHKVVGNPDNNFTINETTGVVRWEVPDLAGPYNIAILIKSYRNGEMIDAMILDMEILVLDEEAPLDAKEEAFEASLIKVFPNPAFLPVIKVEHTSWSKPVLYIIFSADGRKVQEGILADRLSRVDLVVRETGQYYLSVRGERRWITKPFQLVHQ